MPPRVVRAWVPVVYLGQRLFDPGARQPLRRRPHGHRGGGDQTAGVAYGVHYTQGGHVRVLAPTGNAGTGTPSGGLLCGYDADQVVQSSPGVGQFLSGGETGIVVGTGTYWPAAQDTDKLLAFGAHCNLVGRWPSMGPPCPVRHWPISRAMDLLTSSKAPTTGTGEGRSTPWPGRPVRCYGADKCRVKSLAASSLPT